MTVRDLITGSMRLLGVLASGENPAASEMQDALASLNSMLDSWKLEKLMVPGITPEIFPLVAGQMTYTMGPGGDFDTDWPVSIDQMTLLYAQGDGGGYGFAYGYGGYGGSVGTTLNLPLAMLNLDQYNSIILPNITSPIPQAVYIDDSYPLRKINLYYVPSIVNSIQIYTSSPINAFASIDDVLALPPGYERAMRYNLALEIAPEYGKQVPVPVAATAQVAKANIKSFNMKTLYMQVDNALLAKSSAFNWLTGE